MDEVKKKICKNKLKTKKLSYGRVNDDDHEKNVKSNKEFKKIRQENAEDQEDWNFWQDYYK